MENSIVNNEPIVIKRDLTDEENTIVAEGMAAYALDSASFVPLDIFE